MAWHVEQPHAACPADEFAVVEDDDGEVHGCFSTEAEADGAITMLTELNAGTGEASAPPAQASNRLPLVERRVFTVNPQLRAANDAGQPPTFSGHAALFGSLSEDLGGVREMLAPGAFKRTLRNNADVRFLINHDPSLVLARTKSKTLALSEDERGLLAEATLPDTSYARDLAVSMARGDIDQMSFAFQIMKSDWGTLPDGTPLRNVREARLFDVSVVTFPAYPDTNANLRSREFDALVRTLGWDALPDAERETLLADITNGAISTDRRDAFRLAMTALGSLVEATDPPRQHSVARDTLTRRHATYRLLMEAPT